MATLPCWYVHCNGTFERDSYFSWAGIIRVGEDAADYRTFLDGVAGLPVYPGRGNLCGKFSVPLEFEGLAALRLSPGASTRTDLARIIRYLGKLPSDIPYARVAGGCSALEGPFSCVRREAWRRQIKVLSIITCGLKDDLNIEDDNGGKYWEQLRDKMIVYGGGQSKRTAEKKSPRVSRIIQGTSG